MLPSRDSCTMKGPLSTKQDMKFSFVASCFFITWKVHLKVLAKYNPFNLTHRVGVMPIVPIYFLLRALTSINTPGGEISLDSCAHPSRLELSNEKKPGCLGFI